MTTIDRIVAIATAIVPTGHDVAAHSPLADLALDSLSCIELTVAVEEAFDVEIGCGERISFETLSDIAALVDTKVAQRMPLAA